MAGKMELRLTVLFTNLIHSRYEFY